MIGCIQYFLKARRLYRSEGFSLLLPTFAYLFPKWYLAAMFIFNDFQAVEDLRCEFLSICSLVFDKRIARIKSQSRMRAPSIWGCSQSQPQNLFYESRTRKEG